MGDSVLMPYNKVPKYQLATVLVSHFLKVNEKTLIGCRIGCKRISSKLKCLFSLFYLNLALYS